MRFARCAPARLLCAEESDLGGTPGSPDAGSTLWVLSVLLSWAVPRTLRAAGVEYLCLRPAGQQSLGAQLLRPEAFASDL